MRGLFLDHVHRVSAAPATNHLHVRLVVLVRVEIHRADRALVRIAQLTATLALRLGVGQQVLFKVHKLGIRLGTGGAGVRLHPVVDHLVLFEIGPLHKRLVAALTLVRLEATVQQLVLQHVGLLGEAFVTDGTLEWLQTVVHQLMPLQVGQLRESLVADLAQVRPLSIMRFCVLPQAGLVGKGLSTLGTRELVEMLHVPVHFHVHQGVEALSALSALDFVHQIVVRGCHNYRGLFLPVVLFVKIAAAVIYHQLLGFVPKSYEFIFELAKQPMGERIRKIVNNHNKWKCW